MRITLSRSGNIKKFETLLTIESENKDRYDIVSLLQYIKNNGGIAKEELLQEALGKSVSSLIVAGIIQYLQNIGYLNSHATLTHKAMNVIETEKVHLEERGEFSIWYIEDPLLDGNLIHFERSQNKKKNGTVQDFPEYQRFLKNLGTSVLDEHKKKFIIKSFEGRKPKVHSSGDSGTYELRWTISLKEKKLTSVLDLAGELMIENYPQTFNNSSLSLIKQASDKTFLYKVIELAKSENMNWNSSLECLEVPFGELQEEDYINLKTNLSVPLTNTVPFGKFEATELKDIPIRPKNAEHAQKWILMLVKKFIEKKYMGFQEVRDYLRSLLESYAFNSYKTVIEQFTPEYLLKELKDSKKRKAYWNLQAPLDLYMELDQKYIVQNRKRDIRDEQFSMADFVDLIVENDSPDTLVFSSKYILNPVQMKKFELFAEAFQQKGVKDIFLVSSEKREFKNPDIRVETYDEIYLDRHVHPHDRYFAYRSNGNWNLFKMTAELDQCRYTFPKTADIETIGSWKDISFMQIKQEAFPAKLYEKLGFLEEVYQV